MPETRFTEFTALSVDPRVGQKSQPQRKRIMPEPRITEFTALSVDPRVGISRSASETNNCLFLYARLKNGRIMLYPSASVRPSVNFFVSYSLRPIELKLSI